MSGILEGVAAEGFWTAGATLLRRVRGGRIQITSPRPLETLKDPKPFGNAVSFAVEGTLKRLPKDHTIWLLTQDETSGLIWPHGFEPVQYDRSGGKWFGRIGDIRGRRAKIIAVVAPPTSHDFFTYYEKHGASTGYSPLNRVPPECANRDDVQALVP